MTTSIHKANLRIGCDGCPARAVFFIRFTFGSLYLCGHHWGRNEALIMNHPEYLDVGQLVGASS